MKMTRTEELTLSLARGATGKAGDGQILTLLVLALLTGLCLRAEVDLGAVLSAACLLGVLSVLERRQLYAIIERLEQAADGVASRPTDGQTV
jgi:hypothetical protein